MLSLRITPQDVVTLGANIRIQAVRAGEAVRIYIDAPRELRIERSVANTQRVKSRIRKGVGRCEK